MVRANRTRCVFLIGFMGAGKTSVGKIVAQSLRWKFDDLDQIIEQRAGKSIAAIFAEQGEAGFRKLESAALRDLLDDTQMANDRRIIALGGGAFVQAENQAAIASAGATTVLLDAPVEELQRRCAQDAVVRPLAREKNRFAELFRQRSETYSKAQHRVNTMGKSVEQVARDVERILMEVDRAEVEQ